MQQNFPMEGNSRCSCKGKKGGRYKMLLQPSVNLRSAANSTANTSTLCCSTRTREVFVNLEDHETDKTALQDADLARETYEPPTINVEDSASLDEQQSSPTRESDGASLPRRSTASTIQDCEEQESSEEAARDPVGGEEEEDEEQQEGEGEGKEVEEPQGRRRYSLRNRTQVRRFSPGKERKRPRSPTCKVVRKGVGIKNALSERQSGSRTSKHYRASRMDDPDDSDLLVDEMDQGLLDSWMSGVNRNFGQQWGCGGLDMSNTIAWGLNVASSGWGPQDYTFGYGGGGAQTTGGGGGGSKVGADIQPLQVDETVSFDDIGGLSYHIDALKEMVFFPLLYPEFFSNYHISPPRGVLLCGPPGTGKTLIARALACAASKAGQKVNFYMRKGADVLSKWVGEAERQLKLLFEEAEKNQPSIIFFDEIDGLAPVRSSKQEQVHNSIVSTLLALMDGLESRGQVVLIGATNRIDAIDGALRRPGRFDREFVFPLPDCKARAEILKIHTKKWKNPLSDDVRMELAAACVGYCGADLKALCTEAAIRAFRLKYPQVYTTDDQFVIDVDSVKVEKRDFLEAMSAITPAAHRGATVQARPLSPVIAPCLQRHLKIIRNSISAIFHFVAKGDQKDSLEDRSQKYSKLHGFHLALVYRPRLLVCGKEGAGLEHIGPAVLHELESFPVHSLGLPSLLSDPSANTPEEALVHVVAEARRTSPSVLYLPQLELWWETAHDRLRAVLLTLLEELPSNLPVLLLATSCVPSDDLDVKATSLFGPRNIYQVEKPSSEDRCRFISELIDAALTQPDQVGITQKSVFVAKLPKVQRAAKEPCETKLRVKAEAEENAIRRLRMCFRDICTRLLYEKRFSFFHYPVMDEDAPDYYSIVQNPMDITTLLQRVDSQRYLTRSAFLNDVELIPANAKAYNGDDYNGAQIISRAYALRDAVLGMLSQMDPGLVASCDEIAARAGATRLSEDSATRASAGLPSAQTEMNASQRCRVLKHSEQNVASDQHVITNQPLAPTQVAESTNAELEDGESNKHFAEQIESIKHDFLKCTEGYGISELEKLYAQICQGVISLKDADTPTIVKFLKDFSSDESNFYR